ncbi:COMM domain containing 9 [Chamberlinius hualienensis]
MKEVSYESLVPLLQVQNKNELQAVCRWVSTVDTNRFPVAIQNTSNILLIDRVRAENLLRSLNVILQRSATSTTPIMSLYPENFPKQLSSLLSRYMIVGDKEVASKTSLEIQNFVPRMVDFNWQIRVKSSSSSSVSRLSIPTCSFQIKIKQPDTNKSDPDNVSTCVIELTKESVDTVLDGLKKIHDLLSNIAK